MIDGDTSIPLYQDYLGNIEIFESSVEANKVGDILLKPSAEYHINYQPVLIENETGISTLQSDFTFEYGQRVINTEEAHRINKGDKLRMVIPMKDAYNEKLWNDYKKAKGAKVAETRKALVDNAIIYLVNENDEVVQVMKRSPTKFDTDPSSDGK